ncbi:hypothetical protein A33Q_1449 [Indibacter alkaliphilus LW1]|uniref:Uncharacterized protein n=1 Tax=Indibacter alkaliphilus (strain CCUG 57479 / KCTC 22604 / LW1) TaxID=1189612 RepID=S2DNJ3_INDAL|nr:hypothetical protein [Indibacter alkaliphilus]EOZ98795.1 hypothetical protein A33Q_1449 [Indibacter alkaliphilus LW1]
MGRPYRTVGDLGLNLATNGMCLWHMGYGELQLQRLKVVAIGRIITYNLPAL